VKLHRSFLSMSVDVRAIRFHKANGMKFLTSTRHLRGRNRKAPPGIPCWVIGTSFAETTRVLLLRVYPTFPGNPTFVVKAVLECSRAECRRRFLRWTDLDVVLWTR
jgi:hypothetical protein